MWLRETVGKMRKQLGNLWYDLVDGKRFILAIVIALALLLFFLLLQSNASLADSKTDLVKSIELEPGVTLHLAYREKLRLVPAGNLGTPLSAWITAPVTTTLSCTVTLRSDAAILFTDEKGNQVIPQLSVITGNTSSVTPTLYIRPAPLKENLPDHSQIQVEAPSCKGITASISGINFVISIESSSQAWWRIFRENLLAQIGVPLTLAFTLTGFFLEYVRRQTEQADDERRKRIEMILNLESSDPLLALPLFRTMSGDQRRSRWKDTLKTSFEQARLRLLQREGLFWQDIEENIKQNRLEAAVEILEGMLSLLRPEDSALREGISTIRGMLLSRLGRAGDDLPTLEKLSDTAAWLMKTYGAERRELFAQVVTFSVEKEKMKDLLQYKLSGDPVDYPFILKDVRLKEILEPFKVDFYYPVKKPLFFPASPDPILSWLQIMGYRQNPFSMLELGSESLLSKTQVLPEHWEGLKNNLDSLWLAPNQPDTLVIRAMLQNDLQPENAAWQAFVGSCSVNGATLGNAAQILPAAGRGLVNGWLDFLSANPVAWFDLDGVVQAMLAEFLCWGAGGKGGIELGLFQRRDLNKAGWVGRSFLQNLGALSERAGLKNDPPTKELLMQWLSLRPKDLPLNYIIMCLPEQITALERQPDIRFFKDASAELAELGTFIKLLLPANLESYFEPKDVPVKLHWTKEQLQQILQVRLQLVSEGNTQTFGDLFAHEPYPMADAKLASKANGSLSRLLQVANLVLREHVRLNHEVRDLDLTQFLSVLEKIKL